MKLVIDVVDANSTRVWCRNALDILGALEDKAEKVPFSLPPESRLLLETMVCDWLREAECGRPPQPRDYRTDEFRQLVLYWFNITKLTEDERERLGIVFTPPDGRAFADALAAGVADVLFASPELTAFAARLEQAWQDCQPGFTAKRPSSARATAASDGLPRTVPSTVEVS